LTSRRVATTLVRSYRTISTLPAFRRRRRRCIFCSTFRRVAPPSRYEAPRPVEPGLSSISRRIPRPSGLLVRGSITYFSGRRETLSPWEAVPDKDVEGADGVVKGPRFSFLDKFPQ